MYECFAVISKNVRNRRHQGSCTLETAEKESGAPVRSGMTRRTATAAKGR